MFIQWLAKLSPSRIIIVSTVITVITGTALLLLPFSQTEPVSFIDAFFVAISAITGTGLHPVELNAFSSFGHYTIAGLMQIGSLGIIILTIFIVHLFFGPDRSTKSVAIDLLGIEKQKNAKKMLVFVIGLTLVVEIIGAAFILFRLQADFPLGRAIFLSLFHAISAFSNTGFSLFHHNNMEQYSSSHLMLLSLSVLMFLGAIGFTTLKEMIRYLASLTKKVRYRFSLASRIIWKTTLLLIFFAFLLLLFIEHNHAFEHMNGLTTLINALFYVISSMGTGMQAVSSSATHVATMLLIMVIAYIGASPGSTGSGIKTTTLAIFFAGLRSAIKGKDAVILRGHRIDREQVTKAMAIIALSIPLIVSITFLLLLTEHNLTLLDAMFETVSGFATLGISTGITSSLSVIGKLLICTAMILGRVGPFTLLFALKPPGKQGEKQLPKEKKLR